MAASMALADGNASWRYRKKASQLSKHNGQQPANGVANESAGIQWRKLAIINMANQ
jgi:hypothetical protein